MKIAIVVPTHIQPSPEWIMALENATHDEKADVLIVDDSNAKGDFTESILVFPKRFKVLEPKAQKGMLGADSYYQFEKMFRKSSACRVVGHIWAYKKGYDVVIGLDNDCIVPFDFVDQHLKRLEHKGAGWTNPAAGTGKYSRGFPYHMRDWPIVANMGVWKGVLDLNGKDRSTDEAKEIPGIQQQTCIVSPAPFPFSGMNFALKREALPGFLFLPNFKAKATESRKNPVPISEHTKDEQIKSIRVETVYNFSRIDDIWGGYIFQKLALKRRDAVSFGGPIVEHVTQVDPKEDADAEAAMYRWEEEFITLVDHADANLIQLNGYDPKVADYIQMFQEFVIRFANPEAKLFRQISKKFDGVIDAMEWWVNAWRNL